MRTITVVGARPQFIKLAPVSRAMWRAAERGGAGIEDLIVHTGQHYDDAMSARFFDELNIPAPNANLAVGSGAHGAQTGKMLEALEGYFLEHSPDVVIVYGDTNSTLAAALAAAKLHLPIAHIEAGLRSFDRRMPEEVNRIVADHVSDLLLAPTQTAVDNLRREHLADRTRLVGDVMYDAVLYNRELASRSATVLRQQGIEDTPFALATIHRPVNTEPAALRVILDAFNTVAQTQLPVVFPMHPRTRAIVNSECGDWTPNDRLRLIDPVGYLDMLRLLDVAELVITDSGGVQKEAYFLRTPCMTLRDSTEWPETLANGANELVTPEAAAIVEAAARACERGRTDEHHSGRWAGQLFGDGDAAGRIVDELARLAG